ncbi:hypothetical protein K7185_13425 [Clostridium butyricum]|uniref:hypothetical protein n=1 Tax=Clostridium butyricum TaxID=1492 RepID=UPI001CA9070C|nr:hypothetical protein [Clostridium butyricum]MBZ0313470.1 hypothetical protein [Clostridium butyricum]
MGKNSLNLTAQYCLLEHKKAFEKWNEGSILKYWYDNSNVLCVQYDSGNWWHYRINEYTLEWW